MRFFEKEDFDINERTAVIGKGLIDYITYDNGEKYYYIKNNYYKVLGILGDEKRETAYDDEVFVNLDSIIGDDKFNLKGKYILDAGNKSRDVVDQIKEKYKGSSVEIEDINNTSNRSIMKRLKDDYSSIVIHIIKVLFILILSILLVTNFWIRDKSKEIGIRRVLGATKLNVSIRILSELILINISSFLLGYFLYLVSSFFKDGYFHFYFISMLFVFLITLFTGLIAAIIPIYKASKMQPSEIMR